MFFASNPGMLLDLVVSVAIEGVFFDQMQEKMSGVSKIEFEKF